MKRRHFIKAGALFVPSIFIPRVTRGQAFTFRDPTLKCAPPAAGGGGSIPAISSQGLGALRSNFTGKAGCYFTTGAAALTVTHLGRWIVSGNSQTHTVRLFAWCGNGAGGDCADTGPALADVTYLATATVDASGATPGAYLYVALGSPAAMAANTKYGLTSDETSGGDQWYDDDTTATFTADFTLVKSVYTDSSFRANTASRTYVPCNFKYTNP